MARLNQIIAVEKGIESRSFQELTEAASVSTQTQAITPVSALAAERQIECRRSGSSDAGAIPAGPTPTRASSSIAEHGEVMNEP